MKQVTLYFWLALLGGAGAALGQTATPSPEAPPVLPTLRKSEAARPPRDIQFEAPEEPKPKSMGAGYGGGSGAGIGSGANIGGGDSRPRDPNDYDTPFTAREVTRKAVLLAKPQPSYTAEARRNGVEGTVVLRVLLGADRQVKQIITLTRLPNGLTEKALEAASKIQFTPAQKDGRNVSQWVQIHYTFGLYVDENASEVAAKPIILEMPQPEYTPEARSNKRSGKVVLRVVLAKSQTVSVIGVIKSLPDGLTEKAIEAAGKIKFQPALDREGNPISVVKEIEYEFKP